MKVFTTAKKNMYIFQTNFDGHWRTGGRVDGYETIEDLQNDTKVIRANNKGSDQIRIMKCEAIRNRLLLDAS